MIIFWILHLLCKILIRAKIIGCAQSDTIHQSIYDLIHSDDRDELRRQLDWAAFLRPPTDDTLAGATGGADQQTSSGRSRGRDKEQRDQKHSKSGSSARPTHSAQAATNSLPDDPRAALNSGAHSPYLKETFFTVYIRYSYS